MTRKYVMDDFVIEIRFGYGLSVWTKGGQFVCLIWKTDSLGEIHAKVYAWLEDYSEETA
jgi:hypothetical protein